MRKNRALVLLAGLVGLVLALTAPAFADTRIEKNLKLERGGRFALRSDVGSVTVTGVTAAGAKVVITSRRDDLEHLMDFDFEESPGLVRVTGRKKGGAIFGWHEGISLHYEVEVPSETRLEISTGGGGIKVYAMRRDADLNTSGGGIEVEGFAGNLLAHTSGGGISLREITGNSKVDTSGGGINAKSVEGPIEARTSGGSIEMDRVTGDILAKTSGGGIRIDRAGGRVEAETSGGSVEVNFEKGNSRGGELGTSGGSVRVGLDPNANLNIDASTSAGHVNTSLPIKLRHVSKSSLSGSLGSGGAMLRLHSSAGSIDIAAR
jgi:DUF4097 and DUF4098 domain-containing protein YvlB